MNEYMDTKVGLTEDMAGFLALLSVELDWLPEQHLCLPYPCQLKHGSSAYNCSTASEKERKKEEKECAPLQAKMEEREWVVHRALMLYLCECSSVLACVTT